MALAYTDGNCHQEGGPEGFTPARRCVFGYDEQSYVMDLRGCTLHWGIHVLNGAEHEAGQAVFLF